MTKPVITSFNTLAPLIIQQYERYLPSAFDDGLSMLEKVNKIIEYLNQIGELNNSVVEQWNSVMEWVMNDGLTTEVNNKLDEMANDGTLEQIINVDMIGILGILKTTNKNDLVSAINETFDIATDISKHRNAKKYGLTGDGITDDTVAINSLEGGYVWVIPSGTYMIKAHTDDGLGHNGFRPKANTKYIFLKGAKLKAIPNDKTNYSVVWLETNAEIHNIEIEGDRVNHIGTTGEMGYGLNIRNYAKCKVYNPVCYNCWGDGIIINTFLGSDVELHNPVSYDNRRQGISVMCADKLRVYRGEFTNTNGTSPECGIDIEPNYPEDILNDLYFEDCQFNGNNQHGILIYGGFAFPNEYKIIFRNTICNGNVGADVRIGDVPFSENGRIEFLTNDFHSYGINVVNSNAKVFVDGVRFNNCVVPMRFETNKDNGKASNFVARNVEILDGTDTIHAVYFYPPALNTSIENIDIEIIRHNLPKEKVFKTEGTTNENIRLNIANKIETTTDFFSTELRNYAFQQISNKGATTPLTMELNNVLSQQKDLTFEFIVEESQYINITTVATVSIVPIGSTQIRSNVVGSRIKLKFDGAQFVVIEMIGTWETY